MRDHLLSSPAKYHGWNVFFGGCACHGRPIPAKYHGWNVFGGCLLLVLLSTASLPAWKAYSEEDDLIRGMSETILVGKLVSFSTQQGKGTEKRGWYTIQPKKMMKGNELKGPFLGCYMVPDATMVDGKGIVIGFKSPIVSGSGSEWKVKPTHEYIFYLGKCIAEEKADSHNGKSVGPYYQILRIDPMSETPGPLPLKETGK